MIRLSHEEHLRNGRRQVRVVNKVHLSHSAFIALKRTDLSQGAVARG
jgi:hypothetical protein